MSNQELLNYTKYQLRQGVGQDQIKKILIDRGWSVGAVEEAFVHLNSSLDFNIFISSYSSSLNQNTTKFNFTPEQISSPTKELNKTVIAVITAFSFLIISGSVWGFYSLIEEKPAQVFNKMLLSLTQINTFAYQG